MAIPLRARLVERPTPHQQSAKPGQHESRLAQADPPHHFPCFVARGFSERLFCGIIQQVHQVTVVLLLKMVQRDSPITPNAPRVDDSGISQ